MIRLGEWNVKTVDDCQLINDVTVCSDPVVDVRIEMIIPHEGYYREINDPHNDIMLLRLEETITYTAYISPICLPLDETLRNVDLAGENMTVIGFGAIDWYMKAATILMKVDITGTTMETCRSAYLLKIWRNNTKNIIDLQLCAGGLQVSIPIHSIDHSSNTLLWNRVVIRVLLIQASIDAVFMGLIIYYESL